MSEWTVGELNAEVTDEVDSNNGHTHDVSTQRPESNEMGTPKDDL